MIKEYGDLIENIKLRFNQLSPSHKKVAEYIIQNIDKIVFFTISELASQINVSEATIVRFAYKIGFESYSEMHKSMQDIFKAQLSPVKKIEQNIDITNVRTSNVVDKSIDLEIQYLRELKKNLSKEDLENAIEMLQSANNIYVTGLRTSYGVAHLCYLVTKQILNKSFLITSENECIPESVLSLTPDDVIIAISLPRYTERTLHILRYANNKKVKIIAITDSFLSPVGRLADIVLPCNYKGLTYQNTLVPANATVNIIINLLVLSSDIQEKNAIKERIAKIEDNLSEWGIIHFSD